VDQSVCTCPRTTWIGFDSEALNGFSYSTPGFIFYDLPLTSTVRAICPDLLTIHDLGVADDLRGRVVRAFFHIMRLWRPAK
jgi:hypothetical protein